MFNPSFGKVLDMKTFRTLLLLFLFLDLGLPFSEKVIDKASNSAGVVWIRTENSLIRVENNQKETFSLLQDIPVTKFTSMAVNSEGGVWVGSEDGLVYFDGKLARKYTFKDGLFNKNIQSLFYSDNGQIWVATPDGPFVFVGNHFYMFQPLKDQNVIDISETLDHWVFITDSDIQFQPKVYKLTNSSSFKRFSILIGIILIGAALFLIIKQFKTRLRWRTDLIRVEQQALLAQMNPHFIFNSLNSVQRYIMDNDKEAAHEYLQKFSSMMRKVLENSSKPTIVLAEEIATLELYMQIESQRFDHGFDFQIKVQDDEIWQLEIPTMLLQPFVENAIWHGLMNNENRGKIDIRFFRLNQKMVLCEIEDNGIGRERAETLKSKSAKKHQSKGTSIIKRRIKLLNLRSKEKITCDTIDLEPTKHGKTGTLIRMTIPVDLI